LCGGSVRIQQEEANNFSFFFSIFSSSGSSSSLLSLENLKKNCAQNKKKMNFVDGDKRPTNTGGIDDTVKLAAGKMDALVGMDEDGDMQKDYTWDCVIFGDGS